MPRNLTRRFSSGALVIFCCALLATGCATWQGPRIDPTGEQFLIWPNEPTVVSPPPSFAAPAPVAGPIVAPPPGATVVGPPPAAPFVPPAPIVTPVAPLPFGNVQAPPVYSDPPVAPPPALPFVAPPGVPAGAAVPVGAPTPIAVPTAAAPAAPIVAQGLVTPASAVVPCGCDHLRVTPDRLVAPVGSEMILKAGICGGDGFLIANQRVDWTVARNGVGQFGDLGLRDPTQILGWWEAPQKIDEWSATTQTSFVPFTLNSTTPDPCDDVPINRGEAWVTVTSACEGTSIITACAPDFPEYNQATATIYWIDAQWLLPASAVVECGRPHTLTTTVMRRTNGAPMAGWIVRYEVATGASLGYEGGNVLEVPTDATGRASVEVSPKDAGGGVTNVGVTIIRPQTASADAMPRFDLGRSNATITWSAAAAPPAVGPAVPAVPAPMAPPVGTPMGPPGVSPPPFTPPAGSVGPPPAQSTPAPSLPSTTAPPDPYTPSAAALTGKPRLEVAMRTVGPEQVSVGEYVSFQLTITNRGDGIARRIQVSDKFDRGLRHPNASTNELPVVFSVKDDVPPNESVSIPLTFQVIDGGTQCHEVTVTTEGADPVTQKGCVTARQAALEVSITGPRSRVVGQTAEFSAVVKNVGDVAATNIELVVRSEAAIDPTRAEPGSQQMPDGGILLKIERLEPAERRTFRMEAICRTPMTRACTRAILTADGGVNQAAEACVEILPALPGGTGPSL